MSIMMLRITTEAEFSPQEGSRRFSGSPFSPRKIMESFNRRSFSYDKLPEGPITLSILKLDGSSFDVNVMRSATVGDLMQAIEEVFSDFSKKGPTKISWSHVWGHFCLFFDGQKLLIETDSIGSYGIKDGDQLRFIRHVSSTSNVAREQSKKSKQQKPSLLRPNNLEENEQVVEIIDSCEDLENGRFGNRMEEDLEPSEDEHGGFRRFLIPGFLRGWFLYSPLPENAEEHDGGDANSSRKEYGLVLGLREVLGFWSDKGY